MNIILKENETLQTVIERMTASFDMISGLVPAAWWYAVNGETPELRFSDRLRGLLGYVGTEEFPDGADAFLNAVHPDDRESAANAPAAPEDFDVSLRLRRADGVYLPLNMSGCPVQDRTGKLIGIVGAFRESPLPVPAEEQEKKRKALVAKFAGTESAYIVDTETDRFTVLRRNAYLEEHYPSDESFSQSMARYIEEDVFWPDRASARRELTKDNLLCQLEREPEYVFFYRDSSSGYPSWYEMRAARLSETELLLGFSIRDRDMCGRLMFEKLRDNYFGLYDINLDAGLAKIIKTGHPEITGNAWSVRPYPELMRSIASSSAGDAAAFLNRISDIDYLKRCFAEEDSACYVYKSHVFEGDRWVNVTGLVLLRREDGTPSVLAIGFSLLDEDACEKEEARLGLREAKEKLEEDMLLIGGIADEYHALYYFNAEQNSFKVYSLDEEKFPEAAYIVNAGGNPVDTIRSFGMSELVHPDDRSLFTGLTVEGVMQRLAHSRKFSVRFRRKFGSEYLWTEMDVFKYEGIDEKPNSIAVGFAERDADIRGEEVLKQCFRVLGRESSPEEAIGQLLTIIGEFYAAERCRVFEFPGRGNAPVSSFAWSAEGAEPVFGEPWRVSPTEAAVWTEEFRRLGAFRADADGQDGTERVTVFLKQKRIGTLLAAPLTNGDEIEGYIGVVNPTKAVRNVNVLKNAAAVVYSELLKRREHDEEHVTLGKLTDAFVSVFFADLSSDYMRTCKISEEYREFYGDVRSYSATLSRYVREHIAERDRARCARMTSPDHVRKQFRTRDRFSVEMTDIVLGFERNFVFDYIKVNDDGTQLVLCCRDVTETLREEKEQQKRLRAARLEAEEANRAKSNFLFNMSHDIRTPMNAITGFTNMAIRHIDNREKVMDCLEKTQKASGMLLSLINGVLEVSRIESGNAVLAEQPGDILLSFSEIESTMRELAQTKDIRISFEFGTIRDRFVLADRSRCVRIFVNIISNAIKYTPEGGTVKVRCEQPEGAKEGRAVYRYTVEDNGIGMSEEFQKHVFDQFAREKTATVSGIQGTGLGMAVVKSFVDLMGGSVTVRSRQGKGSLFTVDLPFRLQDGVASDRLPVGTVTESSLPAAAAPLAGKRALVVEDNDLNREIAVDILTEERLLVEEAVDGVEAVALLREKGPDYYDFILMDIQMPRMDGYEATRAIRAMYPEKRVPIIALSANAFAEDREASAAAGMDGHVAKPIIVKELLGVLSAATHSGS